jgi:hypothetical protein
MMVKRFGYAAIEPIAAAVDPLADHADDTVVDNPEIQLHGPFGASFPDELHWSGRKISTTDGPFNRRAGQEERESFGRRHRFPNAPSSLAAVDTRLAERSRFGSRSDRIEFAILAGDQIIGEREARHRLETPRPSFEGGAS